MIPPKLEKAEGGNPRLFQIKDCSPSTSITMKDTPEQATRLLILGHAIQSAKVLACEYALETDYPPHGLVECLDSLDEAQDALGWERGYS